MPDQLGPIVAERMWRVADGGLTALSDKGAWSSGTTHAVCRRDRSLVWFLLAGAGRPSRMNPEHYLGPAHERETPPVKECQCGIWAVRSVAWVVSNSGYLDGEGLMQGTLVFGRVKLWGKVYEFEHGWRAEYARPEAIYRLPGFPDPILADPPPLVDAPPVLLGALTRLAVGTAAESQRRVLAIQKSAGEHVDEANKLINLAEEVLDQVERNRRSRSETWALGDASIAIGNVILAGLAWGLGRLWLTGIYGVCGGVWAGLAVFNSRQARKGS